MLVFDLPATDPLPESSELRGRRDERAERDEVEMMMERASRSELRNGSSRGRVVGKCSGSEGWAGEVGKMAERMSKTRS